MEGWLTLAKAAEKYGRNPEALRQAANRGSLKANKVGRDWLVSEEEMERYDREAKRGRPRTSPSPTSSSIDTESHDD